MMMMMIIDIIMIVVLLELDAVVLFSIVNTPIEPIVEPVSPNQINLKIHFELFFLSFTRIPTSEFVISN